MIEFVRRLFDWFRLPLRGEYVLLLSDDRWDVFCKVLSRFEGRALSVELFVVDRDFEPTNDDVAGIPELLRTGDRLLDMRLTARRIRRVSARRWHVHYFWTGVAGVQSTPTLKTSAKETA